MNSYQFKIIYGDYSGVQKRAVEMAAEAVSEYIDYALPTERADCASEKDLSERNLIIIGTKKSNPIIEKLCKDGILNPPAEEEGYLIKVTKSVYDENAQMVVICGSDENGVLYGAADFAAYYIPYAEITHNHGCYFRKIFDKDNLLEYEAASVPSIKRRGIWSWGHVIYDYKNYIRNMARLKMNTLIIWNDFVPVNVDEVIKEAHSYGIQIYLGYSWGWNEARPVNEFGKGGMDLSDDVIAKFRKDIVETYKNSYEKLNIDGIYFQSFTETKNSEINGAVIAERVAELVNSTAKELLELNCDLTLMFGLHATSVCEKLDYIRQTDKRIMIVWEDCGAFPFAYTPNKIENFDETCSLCKKIAKLRGDDDSFGVVTKGLVCLDWTTFKHQKAACIVGEQSKAFIERRTAKKKKLWKYVDAYWLKNGQYAYDMIKLLKENNKNTMITGLIEDGMFEAEIHHSAAIFGEMMWDTGSPYKEILLKTALRKDVI